MANGTEAITFNRNDAAMITHACEGVEKNEKDIDAQTKRIDMIEKRLWALLVTSFFSLLGIVASLILQLKR